MRRPALAFGRWRPLEGDDTTAPVNIGRMSPWEPRMSPWEPRVGCIGRVLDRGVASVWDEMHWTGVAWTEGSVPDVGGSHLIVGNGDSPALARMRSGAAKQRMPERTCMPFLALRSVSPPHTVEENKPTSRRTPHASARTYSWRHGRRMPPPSPVKRSFAAIGCCPAGGDGRLLEC